MYCFTPYSSYLVLRSMYCFTPYSSWQQCTVAHLFNLLSSQINVLYYALVMLLINILYTMASVLSYYATYVIFRYITDHCKTLCYVSRMRRYTNDRLVNLRHATHDDRKDTCTIKIDVIDPFTKHGKRPNLGRTTNWTPAVPLLSHSTHYLVTNTESTHQYLVTNTV